MVAVFLFIRMYLNSYQSKKKLRSLIAVWALELSSAANFSNRMHSTKRSRCHFVYRELRRQEDPNKEEQKQCKVLWAHFQDDKDQIPFSQTRKIATRIAAKHPSNQFGGLVIFNKGFLLSCFLASSWRTGQFSNTWHAPWRHITTRHHQDLSESVWAPIPRLDERNK